MLALTSKDENLRAKTYDSQVRFIRRFARKSMEKIPMGLPIVDKPIVSEALYKIFVQMQLNGEVSWVSTYDESPTSDPIVIEKRTGEVIDGILDENLLNEEDIEINKNTINVIPTIFLSNDEQDFPKKLKAIKSLKASYDISTAQFIYASPITYRTNYMKLRKFAKDNEILLILANMPKTWPGNHMTSMQYLMQIFGFDMFALTPGRPMKPTGIKYIDPKRLDNRTCGYLTYEEYQKKHGNALNCGCPPDKQVKSHDDFYEFFSSLGLGKLNGACSVHSTFMSWKEFWDNRDFILQRKFYKYINNRSALTELVRRFVDIDTKNMIKVE